jgi:hypothetical protein
MAATVEYKEYRIETEEKDGEWFATIGPWMGWTLGAELAGIDSTGPGQGL